MPINKPPASPDKKPGRTTASSSANTTVIVETPRDKDRREGVEGVFSFASMFSLMRGQYADAGAFSKFGEGIAREAVLLARKNESVGKSLDLLGQAGPYAGIVLAVVPLVAQLAVNHGRIDAAKASGVQGVTSPAALEAEVKAELAKMEREALEAQREAEQELAKLKAEQERGGNTDAT